MWKRCAILTALALAACDGGEQAPEVSPAPLPVAPPPERPTPLPQKTFYLGRWAASEAQCADQAWTFTPTGLEAPQGACAFDTVSPTEAGVEIATDCRWAGETTRTRMRLAYAQSAQALLIEDGPAGDMGLIACPEAG